MRGITLAVFLSCLTVISYSNATKADPIGAVQTCLGSSDILNKQLTCEARMGDNTSVLRFVLVQGQEIKVTASGQFGNLEKDLAVFKISHLPPQVTDNGVIGESVEFAAKVDGLFGSYLAIIDMPCQSNFAAIGIGQVSGNAQPSEVIATCTVQ